MVAPTQTVSSRPRRSNVRLAHSATCSVDVTFGLTPSGPGPGYVSVMYASLWMLLPGSGARNGCCGGAGAVTGCGVAGLPTYAGLPGGIGSPGIGIAAAAPALTAPVSAREDDAPR